MTGPGQVVIAASARARQTDTNPADNDATLRIEPAAVLSPSPPSSAAKGVRRTVRTGTAGRDALRGTNGPDSLFGLAGRDVLYGFGGPDTLVGGIGVDRLFGGAGNDTILARDRARDTIACGSGRDVVRQTRPIAWPATANGSSASVDSGGEEAAERGNDLGVDRVRDDGLVVGNVRAGGDQQVARRAAPVDRDHRVEGTVGDRNRVAVQL